MNKELTGQADRIQTNELCALNCEDSCSHTHHREAWLASEDCWYCESCLIDFFIEDITNAVAVAIERYDDETLVEVVEACEITVHGDSEGEFTHFLIEVEGGGVVELTLHQIENTKSPLTKSADKVGSSTVSNGAEK